MQCLAACPKKPSIYTALPQRQTSMCRMPSPWGAPMCTSVDQPRNAQRLRASLGVCHYQRRQTGTSPTIVHYATLLTPAQVVATEANAMAIRIITDQQCCRSTSEPSNGGTRPRNAHTTHERDVSIAEYVSHNIHQAFCAHPICACTGFVANQPCVSRPPLTNRCSRTQKTPQE